MEKKVGDVGESRYPKTQGIRSVVLTKPSESRKCCRTQAKRQNLYPEENKGFRVGDQESGHGCMAWRGKGPFASPSLSFLICKRE